MTDLLLWGLIIVGLAAIASTGGAAAMVVGIPLTLVALALLFLQRGNGK